MRRVSTAVAAMLLKATHTFVSFLFGARAWLHRKYLHTLLKLEHLRMKLCWRVFRCLLRPEGIEAVATGLASYSLLELVLWLLRVGVWARSVLPLTLREAQGILFALQVCCMFDTKIFGVLTQFLVDKQFVSHSQSTPKRSSA